MRNGQSYSIASVLLQVGLMLLKFNFKDKVYNTRGDDITLLTTIESALVTRIDTILPTIRDNKLLTTVGKT